MLEVRLGIDGGVRLPQYRNSTRQESMHGDSMRGCFIIMDTSHDTHDSTHEGSHAKDELTSKRVEMLQPIPFLCHHPGSQSREDVLLARLHH